MCLEPVSPQERGQHNEKLVHHSYRQACVQQGRPITVNKWINKSLKKQERNTHKKTHLFQRGHTSGLIHLLHSLMRVKSLQSCLTLCDPMDHSPPGSSAHGILLARILERAAISFSRWSFQPMDWTASLNLLHWQAGSLPIATPGKPQIAWWPEWKPFTEILQ